MKAECVNPFLQALRDVFKLMLDVDIARSNIAANSGGENGKRVVVQINLTGDVAGAVVFSFPQDTTLEIAKIMSGMEFDKIDGFVTSALGEMSNIISGNAVTYLSKANYRCDILPPRIEIIDGANGISQSGLAVPLRTVVGDLQVDFVLEK